MANWVLSRRLLASLTMLGLLFSTLLVVVPLTAPAAEKPAVAKSHSSSINTGNLAVQSASENPTSQSFNFEDPSAGVPQALRSPIPMRQGAPLTDPRFTYNGTEISGLTDAGKTDLQNNHELTIPDGVTKIAAGVFSGKGLTKVTLPASVTEVADRAFYDNQIKELVAPGLKTIGAGAFQKNKLTVFDSSTVEKFGEGAFTDNLLETLKITDERPDDASNPLQRLTTIPANAFRDNKLTAVTLPKYVTEIGASAFANNQLTVVAFPPNLEKVGQEAFSGNQIKEVKIPATITTFGKEVFSNNKRWVVLEKADERTPLPIAVKSEKYASGFGQVAAEDAVSITINYLDADTNNPLRSPQVLQSEFTEPDGVYLAGKSRTIKAPQITGYQVKPAEQKITPQAGAENAVTFTYEKKDFSPKIWGEINKYIPKGGDGSTAALLAKVSAKDTDGWDITKSLKVSPEKIDTSVQDAVYDIYYNATDSQGRTKTVKGKVAVGTDWPEKTICPGWKVKDFRYQNSTILGFSESGRKNHAAGMTKGDWCWPTFGDKGQPITEIGEYAFNRVGLTKLPKSWAEIKYLGRESFYYNQLTSLPDSWGKLEQIGQGAFGYNRQLEKIPDSWGNITSLGNTAFQTCHLSSLPKSWGKLVEVPEGAFNINQLTSLPDSWDSITRIGDSAFGNNKLVSLPPWGKVTSVGFNSFSYNQLTKLPESWGNMSSLGRFAFSHNQLTSLPESWGKVSDLREGVFAHNQLASLPESWGKITKLPDSAFLNNQLTTLPVWGADYQYRKICV